MSVQRPEKVGILPIKFKGVKSDARRFLTALQMYLSANKDSYHSEEKILSLAFSLCEDKAAEWIQPYMQNSLQAKDRLKKASWKEDHPEWVDDDDNDFNMMFEDEDFLITSFNSFLQKFKEVWISSNSAAEAQITIQNIIQGTSLVSEYHTKYMLVAAQTSYRNIELLECFHAGLAYTIWNMIST